MNNPQDNLGRRSGAEILLSGLMANGVDTVFGLPGGQLNDFYDAMAKAGPALTYVGSRHEQGAAYMAFGYAKATGRVGAYTVVPGPGVLNTGAALCSAYANSSPVLCVTGQIASGAIGRGVGELHELPDQLATLKTLTKHAARINHPTEIDASVYEAFRQLTTGRPRPVALETPPDIMAMEAIVPPVRRFEERPDRVFDLDRVRDAAKSLATSKRPLIVVGGGATHAGAEIFQLAEMLQAPVISFRNGRGVVSDAHYLGQTFAAGYELWRDADVVLGVGSRMQPYLQEWGVDADLTLIRVDWDPTEIDRIVTADIGVCGDAKAVCGALYDEVGRVLDRRESRAEELEGLKARIRSDVEGVQPQLGYLDAIREVLPPEGVLVDEITQVGFASWFGFPVYGPRRLITCGYQGTLGYGYATALGVKVGTPHAPVVSIAGDGGFMFNVQELATAAQYGIDLNVIVFNNGMFGNVRRHQEEWYGGRFIGSELRNPDFAALAETFGVEGRKADSPTTMKAQLREALDRPGPSLIEVSVGEMSSPWRYILREPLRGARASPAGATA